MLHTQTQTQTQTQRAQPQRLSSQTPGVCALVCEARRRSPGLLWHSLQQQAGARLGCFPVGTGAAASTRHRPVCC